MPAVRGNQPHRTAAPYGAVRPLLQQQRRSSIPAGPFTFQPLDILVAHDAGCLDAHVFHVWAFFVHGHVNTAFVLAYDQVVHNSIAGCSVGLHVSCG